MGPLPWSGPKTQLECGWLLHPSHVTMVLTVGAHPVGHGDSMTHRDCSSALQECRGQFLPDNLHGALQHYDAS
jgi:hypothetical protein